MALINKPAEVPMSKKVKEYEIKGQIGSGQFGVVHLALHIPTNQVHAVKILNRQKILAHEEQKILLQQEIGIHKTLNHLNIVKLYDVCETTNNYYMFMEYCNDGDLEKKLKEVKKFPEKEALYYLKQMMNACFQLNKMKISHRDIKPENFLLHRTEDSVLKLADFGFAHYGVSNVRAGSVIYMAPEVLAGLDGPYTNKVDIWSLGVVFYRMLFGTFPFTAESSDELLKKLQDHQRIGTLVFPKSMKVCGFVKTLLNSMLQYNPDERISWEQLYKHGVFTPEYVPESCMTESMNAYILTCNQEKINKDFQDNLSSFDTGSEMVQEGQSQGDAFHEQKRVEQFFFVQVTTTVSARLEIPPEMVVEFVQKLIEQHERKIVHLLDTLSCRSLSLASQLRMQVHTREIVGTQSWEDMITALCTISYFCLLRATSMTAQHAVIFSERGAPTELVKHCYPMLYDKYQRLPHDLCQRVSNIGHSQFTSHQKCCSNALRSIKNILGHSGAKMLQQIESLESHQETQDPMVQMQHLIYESPEYLKMMISKGTEFLKLVAELTRNIPVRTLKDISVVKVFLSECHTFFSSQDELLLESNPLKFLDKNKLSRKRSQNSGMEDFIFRSEACFDWAQFERQRVLPEFMTQSVQNLYKALGLAYHLLSNQGMKPAINSGLSKEDFPSSLPPRATNVSADENPFLD